MKGPFSSIYTAIFSSSWLINKIIFEPGIAQEVFFNQMASAFRALGRWGKSKSFLSHNWAFEAFEDENTFLKKQIYIYSEFDPLPGEAFIASVISMELCQIT